MFVNTKRTILFSLLLLILTLPAAAEDNASLATQGAVNDARANAETARKIKIAFTQHEVILLLIQNNRFDQVLREVDKILDLNLPPKLEEPIVKSLVAIAYKLFEAKQSAIAHEVLDKGFQDLILNANKADILRFKAYLHKENGEIDAAIDTFKRASELDNKPNQD